MKLRDRVAVVTGAARGIGRASALELARHGAVVLLCDLASRTSEAESAVREIEQLGSRALFCPGDVADRAADERMMETAIHELGRLDILVNDAAAHVQRPFLELEPAEVERVWAVSLWGVFHCSQLAARKMVERKQGGSIVMISSVHAYRPFPFATAYNAAKAAVNHMARTWAVELAPYRIRVNVIEPGWIDTPGQRVFYDEEQIREKGKALLMGRLGTPEEIAKGVVFLASDDDSSYVTGSCLRIDGGFVLPKP